MTSMVSSPRRLQSQQSIKRPENTMNSPSHPGRQPLRAIPESSASRSSSTSEKTESDSPSRPPTPRGKKRAAAVYRQSENVDGNIGSASNTPEKPREKRTTLTRVSKVTVPWTSKLPVTASLARALQESLQQTDAANKSWDSDSIGGTPTTISRTPLIPITGASKSSSIEPTSRTLKFSGKPPIDSELSRSCFGSSNSSLFQSTPTRSVNRSLRYGATPSSVASIGSSRAPSTGVKLSGSFQFNSGQQSSAQQFDFEEDNTFWEDHNVQVILRTRPINASESSLKGFSRCVRQENSHSITWIGQPETRFTFDHVAGEHITQEKLFRVAGVPMVDNCMAGYNSCMFCYGQTGSGKTHTMLGNIVDLELRPSDDRGITPRVFEYLFSKIQKEEESRTDEHLNYVCKCSFLEIFNEQITDLLEPNSTNLQVREGGKKGVYVENLSEVAVESVQDVVHLLLLGAANRKVAATNMNRESSRSHSVFTCTIESKWEFNSATNIRYGRLNLVDLAGSERQKTSGAEGERLKEAANINKSLSTLGLVIMILVDVANGKQRHVPYRDSKLTYLLQDSLGGNSKTTMIANISPSSCCALETLSTLKFAQRAKFIRNNAIVNEDASGDVNGLRQEIQELKEELDRIRRQELPRTPSVNSLASFPQDSVRKGDSSLGMALVAIDEQDQSRCSLDAWDFGKVFSGPRFSNKKLEAMEAVLAGALRREQEAEISQKRQASEIEQLTRLVKQREDDSQCNKMVLRFREDKIRRLEALSAGLMSADVFLRQENDFLMNELRLLQEKADRNPELTRFAMENIRLLEQLRRFQDFYTGGEREAMDEEISNLRDQLLEVLDSKLSLTALTSPQREALAPELAAAKREIELLRIETENYRREVEDCRKNLSSILEANSKITKQLDESNAELREVKLKNQVHQEDLQKLREKALDTEAIEWGHVQHLELISNLKIKLQQSTDRADREASLRFELDGQLKSSLEEAADLQADLQETRGALDAAEVLVSRLQTAELDLSVAQEMAILAQNAVRQIHLEAKEIAEDQRLSLKHTEDAVVAACMKDLELREELKEAHSLIQKLSKKGEPICSDSSAASVRENEQEQRILISKGIVGISQLEKDLKSLDLLFGSECSLHNSSLLESAREGLESITNLCDETSTTKRNQSLYLEQGKDCILKLNFTPGVGQPVETRSALEDSAIRELQDAGSRLSDLEGEQDLEILQGNNVKVVDQELVQAIRCLEFEIMKLKPLFISDEQRQTPAKWSTIELVEEVQSLVLVVQDVRKERKDLALQTEALLTEKDIAIKALQEREGATSKLLDHLNEGEHALTDAVREMEGILDDCLAQSVGLSKDRVQEREPVNIQQSNIRTTRTAQKDTEQARQAGGNSEDFLRKISVCTTMLHWFSETLTAESTVKSTLKTQNDRAREELDSKDRLISSLQEQLERALANVIEKDCLISKLQNEYDRDRARLVSAESQVTAASYAEAKLLVDIEKHRLEMASLLKRVGDGELELAQTLDVLTSVRADLIESEMERDQLTKEKEQLAPVFAYEVEALDRSCSVAAILVWWLQSKFAADVGANELSYDDIASQVKDRDRVVLSLQDEITEKATLLEEQMRREEILAHQNLEQVRDVDNKWKVIVEKDILLSIAQTSALSLQDELLVSEDRSKLLAIEKEMLQIQLCELAKNSEALQGLVSSVQKDLQEAEAKVVELAIVQAGMLIAQEEWGLEKDRLERHVSQTKQRCTQLEQELQLARSVALKLETELEVAKTQEILLCEERDKVVTFLQEELIRTQASARDFKDQSELNLKSAIEVDSRLQKHLVEWEIERETMLNAAVLASDQCLEKDQALTSVQACLGTLQSQLLDTCSRESELSHDLGELLQSKEKTQRENEMLRSKAEELVLVVNLRSQEISRLEQLLEATIQITDDKVEDTHRQMKAILVDLDVLILVKEKLEADAESIKQSILQHCSSFEQQLAIANEDKNQLKEQFADRESEVLRELNTLQSGNMSFGVRVQVLEDALEDAMVHIEKKEQEIIALQRDWTESENKAVETQENLRVSNLLTKELALSEEQSRLQSEALVAENKRLTLCIACREIEFSSLQDQIEGLEKRLKESHEKEIISIMTLGNLKESLNVLEKQWQIEREQMKDRLVTASRELFESQEMNQVSYDALKEVEGDIIATEEKCQVSISELGIEWGIARGEMSSHISQISLDFIEMKSCAEKTHLDLAMTRSLLSAADAAIEQLLDNSSALKDNNNQLLVKQEALQSELSRWEQYAVDLQKSSCFVPSPCNDQNGISDSVINPFSNYFDILKREVDKTRLECERLRAQVFDKDSTLLSVQMDLNATIGSSRELELELACVADERNDLKLQLTSLNRALVIAQDEVRCRDVELKTFDCELHKIMEVLVKTEEKMDESSLQWRKQIEEIKAEMEDAKLCASEKSTEAILLRKQFEDGQVTLREAEILVNALVRANESAKRDVLKWKAREEAVTLQSSEMLSMLNDEVSMTMVLVDKQFQDLSFDIHGMNSMLTDVFSETAACFDHEIREFMRIQVSEIECASEGARMKLANMNDKVTALEQKLHESFVKNKVLQESLDGTQDLLRGSQAALEDAMQNMDVQQKGYATTRDELQEALASLAGKSTEISELSFKCDLLSTRTIELESLFTEKCEELGINVAYSKELEIEKSALLEKTEMLQAETYHLHGEVKQLEMSLVDAMHMKQVVDMAVVSLKQKVGSLEHETRIFEADLASSNDVVKAAAAKLLDREDTIQALSSNLENSHKEIVRIQGSLDKAVTEVNDLRQLTHKLEEKEAHLMAQAEAQGHLLKGTSEKLVRAEAEFDASVEILTTMLNSTSSELYAAETSKGDLIESNTKLSSLLSSLQVTLSQVFREKGFLSERVSALDEDKKNLQDRLEMQNKHLCMQSLEASAASAAQELQLEILKTIIESVSREVQEKDHIVFVLQEKLQQSCARCFALDEDKSDILERLEIQCLELSKLSQEASAVTTAHQTELEGLKTMLEANSREVQERDRMILSLGDKLERSSERCLTLGEEKKELLERLESQLQELSRLSQECSTAYTAHLTELGSLKTMAESASRELQEKDRMTLSLQEKLDQSRARCLALNENKKDILERLEIQSHELLRKSQEVTAVSAAHHIELEILRTFMESASIKLLEKDHIIASLRENLEESRTEKLGLLESLECAMVATAQIEHERDEVLATANNLESEKRVFREEVNMKSRNCADLEMRMVRLQTEAQEASSASCKQNLELEILTAMLESAVQESREKDARASDLETLLSQSQLQNSEMLQSSQEVVNHYSRFQSQLDACFQRNKELENNNLVLTDEICSLSQEIAEIEGLRQASEKCLDELKISIAQLEIQKDEEVRVLSGEIEKLKSQEAAMEVDLWDWEQRCQDTEVLLDEKVSELQLLRGKLVATQEEYKERLELVYDELRESQQRASEIDSERQDLINEIEEESAIVAELQAKLQIREIEMEEHFSRHSIEQEVLDSLEDDKRELESSVRHLTAEVAANKERAAAAENMQVETRLEMEAVERDLKQKDDLLESLESDLNLLQESALQELRLNQELDSLRITTDVLQQELCSQKERRTKLEIEIGQVTEEIVQTRNHAATWKEKAYELETELDKKRQTIESLEDELRMAEQNMANTLEEATVDLKEVENERDRLQVEVLELTEQLEMTQTMVEEHAAVVSELHQVGEVSRTLAKEKEDEVKLLTRSVHELESTVYALESQLGLLKREAERQRLLREDIEMESQKLNNHIFVTQSALEESNTRTAEELKDVLSALKDTERKVEDKESEISHFRKKLENLEIASKDKDVQIRDAMAQISDLLLAAEVQKSDYQQKLKRIGSQVERSKAVYSDVQSGCSDPNSRAVATEIVCPDANPAQESRDMTHVSCLSRTKELEELASSLQKEVFTLHTRLAEAESMTHDVVRDLLGVKADMNNVASMLDHQQIKQLAETACRKNLEAEEMETELTSLKAQLNAYIEERDSWIEEISLRQCEMVAASVAAENLRLKEQVLTDEIEKFRIENINHQEKIRELETEILKLPSNQQSFYQQINHHARIKEENESLKLANEELSKGLRRTELLHAGMHDELEKYRLAEGKSTSPNVDDERLHLRHLLQESEDNRAEAAQKLSSLCTAIVQAAGLSVTEPVDAPGAMDALQLLEKRLRTTELELSDSKPKVKFAGERRRRTDVTAKDSPLRSISNFTDLLQRAACASPAPR